MSDERWCLRIVGKGPHQMFNLWYRSKEKAAEHRDKLCRGDITRVLDDFGQEGNPQMKEAWTIIYEVHETTRLDIDLQQRVEAARRQMNPGVGGGGSGVPAGGIAFPGSRPQ